MIYIFLWLFFELFRAFQIKNFLPLVLVLLSSKKSAFLYANHHIKHGRVSFFSKLVVDTRSFPFETLLKVPYLPLGDLYKNITDLFEFLVFLLDVELVGAVHDTAVVE